MACAIPAAASGSRSRTRRALASSAAALAKRSETTIGRCRRGSSRSAAVKARPARDSISSGFSYRTLLLSLRSKVIRPISSGLWEVLKSNSSRAEDSRIVARGEPLCRRDGTEAGRAPASPGLQPQLTVQEGEGMVGQPFGSTAPPHLIWDGTGCPVPREMKRRYSSHETTSPERRSRRRGLSPANPEGEAKAAGVRRATMVTAAKEPESAFRTRSPPLGR